ncbi:MAG: hypothetical protein AAF556_07855, partial [Pseudomonadota bacterium]
MASYRHTAPASTPSEAVPRGYGDHLGMVLNLSPTDSHGHGPVTAVHANWQPSHEVSVADNGRRLLMLHWGLPRRFSMRRNQQFVGCFDAQPGDWTIVEPGALETVETNGSGPLLLVWFDKPTTPDSAVAEGASADMTSHEANSFSQHHGVSTLSEGEPKRRGLQGGHHSE